MMRAISAKATAEASMFEGRSFAVNKCRPQNIEGQAAVAVVITVEEPAFLMPMERIVGGIEIEDDTLGWRLVRLQEQRNQMRLDGLSVKSDLVIARQLLAAELERVQRRLGSHRRTILATS
jgi:hypothetical protein